MYLYSLIWRGFYHDTPFDQPAISNNQTSVADALLTRRRTVTEQYTFKYQYTLLACYITC